VLLAIFLSLIGCGYHFPGSGEAPGKIHTVAVDVLQNQTAEIGIETQFTNAIIGEFVRWKRLQVKPKAEAEAVLGGRVSGISTQDIVHLGPQKTLETRVTVTLQLTLKRAGSGEILWQNQDLSYYEDYQQSPNPLTTTRNRREAIQEIALFLAEKVHNDIFEKF
jgi:outer membrane lipopolysaccharide assembly protein LptE/RlpB